MFIATFKKIGENIGLIVILAWIIFVFAGVMPEIWHSVDEADLYGRLFFTGVVTLAVAFGPIAIYG